MNDKCVACERLVIYEVNTPAEERDCYIDGLGQLCDDCYDLLLNYTHVYE